MTFTDLSPEAQARALEKYRQDNAEDEFWADYTIDYCTKAGAVLGIVVDRIGFSGFWSQGDGAHFEGSYAHAPLARLLVRAEYPDESALHRIADELHDAQMTVGGGLSAVVRHQGHYQHEMCTSISIECDEDAPGRDEQLESIEAAVDAAQERAREVGADYYELAAISNRLWTEMDPLEKAGAAVESALRAFMRWIYVQLEDEYNYQTSDEAVIERIDQLDDEEFGRLALEDAQENDE